MSQSQDALWYCVDRAGASKGPMTLDALVATVAQTAGPRTLVYGPGMNAWTEAGQVPAVAERLTGGGFPPVPPPPGMPSVASTMNAPSASRRPADVIDYEIFGEEMQYVLVTLDPGETVIAEPGGMMFMTPDVQMETRFGDPSSEQQSGFLGKLMTAGKRALTGESLFMTTFTASGAGRAQVAFAAPYPGTILAIDVGQLPEAELICQKDSFLAAARGVSVGIAFQKKIGVGLFGGEGFIMQRLSGAGLAFVHAGGCLVKRTLAPGEQVKVDTGCIVAFTKSVQYDIQMVGGMKNKIFGGEGLFFAILTGPGEIWLQSLPFSRLAGRVVAAVGGGKGEGSVLGGVGRMLGGDNS